MNEVFYPKWEFFDQEAACRFCLDDDRVVYLVEVNQGAYRDCEEFICPRCKSRHIVNLGAP